MKRRQFLGSALVGVGGLLSSCGGGSGDDSIGGWPVPDGALTEGQPLRTLDVLPNESADPELFSATLTAAPASVPLVPGRRTPMLRYNGMSPGPLIELRERQRVRIRLDNQLAEDTTIHWHGLPVPPDQDGNPMDPVAAGTSRYYEYDLPAGSAGTYWYHPHPHYVTAAQVLHGLAAPLIVRADDDPLAHVPETTLFITGLRLDPDATISADDTVDWNVGRQREMLLVNGGRVPVHTVVPGSTQRWRVVNATASRHFRLALDGHTLTLVGTDGGLLGSPISGLPEILIGPAQRIEVLVDVKSAPDARYSLRALRYQTDSLGLGTYADEVLLTLATNSSPPSAPVFIPSSLRPIADLGPSGMQQRVQLDAFDGMCTRTGATIAFLINGASFDPNRVDLVTTVGQVELWDVVNRTGMAHPFHIHGTQFQLVSRRAGGVVTPAPYLAWIDTVVVPARETATIKVRQTLPGKRMFHCHILEHEDACMMAILDVRPA